MIAGFALVLGQMSIINWSMIWPAGMLLLSIMFYVQYFTGRNHNPGVLVPAGILLLYGSLFMYASISSWGSISDLWPIFLVGPGFGLMQLKLFSRGKQGSWVPVIILFSLAIFFFIRDSFSSFPIAVAAILIVVGVIVIIASLFSKKDKTEEDKNTIE